MTGKNVDEMRTVEVSSTFFIRSFGIMLSPGLQQVNVQTGQLGGSLIDACHAKLVAEMSA